MRDCRHHWCLYGNNRYLFGIRPLRTPCLHNLCYTRQHLRVPLSSPINQAAKPRALVHHHCGNETKCFSLNNSLFTAPANHRIQYNRSHYGNHPFSLKNAHNVGRVGDRVLSFSLGISAAICGWQGFAAILSSACEPSA